MKSKFFFDLPFENYQKNIEKKIWNVRNLVGTTSQNKLSLEETETFHSLDFPAGLSRDCIHHSHRFTSFSSRGEAKKREHKKVLTKIFANFENSESILFARQLGCGHYTHSQPAVSGIHEAHVR